VVVPVTYCYLDDLAQWFKRQFSARVPPGEPRTPGASAAAAD